MFVTSVILSRVLQSQIKKTLLIFMGIACKTPTKMNQFGFSLKCFSFCTMMSTMKVCLYRGLWLLVSLCTQFKDSSMRHREKLKHWLLKNQNVQSERLFIRYEASFFSVHFVYSSLSRMHHYLETRTLVMLAYHFNSCTSFKYI